MELRNLCPLFSILAVIHTGWTQERCKVQVTSAQVFAPLNEWVLLNCTYTCTKPSWESRLKKRNMQEGDHWVSTEVLINDWETSSISCLSDNEELLKSTVKVQAYALPSEVTIDLDGELEEGQSHEVTCTVFEVAPLANLGISVMRGGKVIETAKFAGDTSKGTQSLSESFYFTVSRRDHLQNFYCQATLDLGTIENNVVQSDEVQVKTFAKPEVPTISVSPSTTVTEDESITLTCQSEGNPEPTYSWNIPSDVHVTYSQDNSTVTIPKATSRHRGSYMCVATNKHGRVRGEQILDILKKPGAKPGVPTISVTPATTVKEGETITLTCRSEGDPEPEYAWTLPSDVRVTYSEDNSTVTITKTTSEHRGSYLCVAANKHGRVHGERFVDIMKTPGAQPGTPFITVFPQKVVKEGESLNLTCHSEGFPKPEYLWTVPSMDHASFSADKRIVFITKATSAHNGTYECVARNTHGKVSNRIVVWIIGQSNGAFLAGPPSTLLASALAIILALL